MWVYLAQSLERYCQPPKQFSGGVSPHRKYVFLFLKYLNVRNLWGKPVFLVRHSEPNLRCWLTLPSGGTNFLFYTTTEIIALCKFQLYVGFHCPDPLSDQASDFVCSSLTPKHPQGLANTMDKYHESTYMPL